MDPAFEAETLHSTGIYTKHPVAFVRGEGATLWDSAGRASIDCMAGHAVPNLRPPPTPAPLPPGRPGIVAAMRGFHGRTLGALSATWNKHYREPFQPLVPGFRHVAFNNIQTLEETVDDHTAAVVLEVVQGEGGVHLGTPEFLQA